MQSLKLYIFSQFDDSFSAIAYDEEDARDLLWDEWNECGYDFETMKFKVYDLERGAKG